MFGSILVECIGAPGVQKKLGVGWFIWKGRIGPRLMKGEHWEGEKEVKGSRTEAIAQGLVCSKPKQIIPKRSFP